MSELGVLETMQATMKRMADTLRIQQELIEDLRDRVEVIEGETRSRTTILRSGAGLSNVKGER